MSRPTKKCSGKRPADSSNDSPPKRQKVAPQPEPDFIACFAFAHTEHEKFLEYFKNEDETIFKNYLRLATEEGALDSYQGNPLAFIILNQPACCYPIAQAYILERTEEVDTELLILLFCL